MALNFYTESELQIIRYQQLMPDPFDNGTKFEPKAVVEIVLPKLGRQTSYNHPVFKYTSATNDAPVDSGLAKYLSQVNSKDVDYWISSSMRKARGGKSAPQSVEELIGNYESASAKEIQQMLNDIAFVPADLVNLAVLRSILVHVYERFDPIRNKSEQTLTTNFRRLVRIYDWLSYGHKKTPEVP